MSTNTSVKKPQKHWITPTKGKWRGGTHLLIWIDETRRKGVVTPSGVWCYLATCDQHGTTVIDGPYDAQGDLLERQLDEAASTKGTLTIWLREGWDDLVLSGLAKLIDEGAITWRYCNIDGRRLTLRGAWRGKDIVVTTLTAWTGGTWDEWRSKTDLSGRKLFLFSWVKIAEICHVTKVGCVAASAGAAGQLAWRSWLGPVVTMRDTNVTRRGKKKSKPDRQYVIPIPSRPLRAQQAERHCCYGLVVRQLCRGTVAGEIYAVDATSMYLTALASTPLPAMYVRTLHRPSIYELSETIASHTGCALVCLQTEHDPYPKRVNGRVVWATGEYWTWLCGAELAFALQNSHVIACECAHIWAATYMSDKSREIAMEIARVCDISDQPVAKAAWRCMYSHLVGRFASWRRVWKDTPAIHQFGRWSSWLQADHDTGRIVTHRSIAGRCQKLSAREDSGESVPLMFGCVTSYGRWFMSHIASYIDREHILAIEADSLWLTRAGWQILQSAISAAGYPVDLLRVKSIYDRAWMTGEHVAVVEREGKQYIVSPGVPADIVVGPNGRVEWPLSMDWHVDGDPDARRGVRRFLATMAAEKIIASCPKEMQRLPYSDHVCDPILGNELLRPYGDAKRVVDDE